MQVGNECQLQTTILNVIHWLRHSKNDTWHDSFSRTEQTFHCDLHKPQVFQILYLLPYLITTNLHNDDF